MVDRERLAPTPDFRYVGFTTAPLSRRGLLATYLGLAASVGASVGAWIGPRGGAAFAIVTAASLGVAYFHGRRGAKLPPGKAVPLAVVPWGVLLDGDGEQRVLHWAAVRRVHLEMRYGREGGTPHALFSVVTVETDHERISARAIGAVPLEGLMVHLEAYAEEAAHEVALEMDETGEGTAPAALGAEEPRCESLLSAVKAYLDSAPASSRLDLPSGGYRTASAHVASPTTLEILSRILRDRTAHAVDPRPFAAVVAAELRATSLRGDLLALVQSPHPVVAAVCRVAARRLGAGAGHAGALDEVAPFLRPRDVEALTQWARA